jgi:hypothetical protein
VAMEVLAKRGTDYMSSGCPVLDLSALSLAVQFARLIPFCFGDGAPALESRGQTGTRAVPD